MAVAACCGAMALPAVAAAAPRAKPAPTGVTINTWPKGLFGYVKSPKSAKCAAGRWVIVYEQRGKRQRPAADRRIARVRARGGRTTYQWSIRTGRNGRFYARVTVKRGCAVSSSRSVKTAAASSSGADENAGYPLCGPWISDTGYTICRFERLDISAYACSSFDNPRSRCRTIATSGQFPWGVDVEGRRPEAGSFSWRPTPSGTRSVTYSAPSGRGDAYLDGYVLDPTSTRVTILDGFAPNETGSSNGDHFYTPDIPGQEPGEVGGPLRFDYVDRGGISSISIEGYLYLKR